MCSTCTPIPSLSREYRSEFELIFYWLCSTLLQDYKQRKPLRISQTKDVVLIAFDDSAYLLSSIAQQCLLYYYLKIRNWQSFGFYLSTITNQTRINCVLRHVVQLLVTDRLYIVWGSLLIFGCDKQKNQNGQEGNFSHRDV